MGSFRFAVPGDGTAGEAFTRKAFVAAEVESTEAEQTTEQADYALAA